MASSPDTHVLSTRAICSLLTFDWKSSTHSQLCCSHTTGRSRPASISVRWRKAKALCNADSVPFVYMCVLACLSTRHQYYFLVHVLQIQVSVLDINDNRPQFTQALYEVSIGENTAPGTDIITVTATDLDEDKRLFYTIHASTDQTSRAKFRINSETGASSCLDIVSKFKIFFANESGWSGQSCTAILTCFWNSIGGIGYFSWWIPFKSGCDAFCTCTRWGRRGCSCWGIFFVIAFLLNLRVHCFGETSLLVFATSKFNLQPILDGLNILIMQFCLISESKTQFLGTCTTVTT